MRRTKDTLMEVNQYMVEITKNNSAVPSRDKAKGHWFMFIDGAYHTSFPHKADAIKYAKEEIYR